MEKFANKENKSELVTIKVDYIALTVVTIITNLFRGHFMTVIREYFSQWAELIIT